MTVFPTFRATVLVVLALLLVAVPAPCTETPPSATARIRIDVQSAAGDAPVLDPYVAVVAETAPWAEPTREAVVDVGSSVIWRLPPGRYRVAAGASGHAITYGSVIALEAGVVHRERVVITPMHAIGGRVVDEDGAPLPGATVSHLRRLVHDFSLRLSLLGEKHLAATFEGVADEQGRFEVYVHPDAGSFLAARADNREPHFFPNSRLPDAESALRDIVLAPGGSLVASWPKSETPASNYDRIQLRQVHPSGPPDLDPALALAVWARPFPGSGRAEWSSLPPGRYEIWLKAPPQGAHDLVPVDLGRVSITAGGRLEERLDPPAPARAPAPTGAEAKGAGAIEFLLPTLSSSELETLEIREWWGPETSGPRELAFAVRQASGGSLIRIEHACRPGAALTLVTDSRVGTLALDRTGCGADGDVPRVDLALRADLELRVTAPPGETLPAVARLSVGPCIPVSAPPGPRSSNYGSSSATPVRLELRAMVEVEGGYGTVRTPTAAGCTSVTARIGDFAALDWPDLETDAGSTVDLGFHRLRRGAALLARVFSATDGRPLDGVVVRAIDPDRALAALQRADAGNETARAERLGTVTSRGGWARLHGLPPGRHLVVLLHADGHRLPHAAADIRLAPGEERILDSLELPPPASVEVRVSLSRRLEEMAAVPHQIFLRQTGESGPPLSLSRDVGPEGTVLLEDLPAGAWRLEGIARAADGRPFPAGSTEFELAAGEHRIVDLALADSLYEGRVTYEGIPVAGSISVTPVAPADRRGMTVLLDEDGRFQLPLEGPGTYTVRIYDQRDRRFSEATLAAVEFGDPEEHVRIRVPEGRIGGKAIDPEGVPVPGTIVRLEARLDLGDGRFLLASNTARASASGEFLAEGLSAGAWTVTAEAGDRQSEPQAVVLAPGERLDRLELVVESMDRVRGEVSRPDGQPASNARIEITPQPGSAAEIPPFLRTLTDARGRFALSTVHAGRPANIRIFTAEGSAAALRTELRKDLRIDLPPMSGAAEIELPCSLKRGGISGTYFLVGPGGAFVPLPALGRSERVSDEPCRVVRHGPGIGMGAWRIVQVNTPAEEFLLLVGAGASLESGAELVARPGAPAQARVEAEH